MKSNLFKLAITTVAVSAFLVACGSSDSTPAPVAPTPAATTATTANVTAASVGAVSGQAFAFPAGSPLSTAASTLTITDAATDTFAVTSTAGNYSGELTYGSCIFKILTSTFAAPSPYAVGQTFTVPTCSVSAATSGVAANGQSNNLPVTFNLGGTASSPVTLPVVISPSGAVTVGGVAVGTVVVVTPTGS